MEKNNETAKDKSDNISAAVVKRRRFLNAFLSISGMAVMAGIVYPIIRYLTPPENPGAILGEVEVGAVDKFPPNTGTIFRYGTKPGMLIHQEDGTITAVIAVCTHLSCTVEYREDHKDLFCACHAGRFDLNGKNIAGPPPEPLEKFHVDVRDGVIYVRKEDQT